jgi:hypothetical protein
MSNRPYIRTIRGYSTSSPSQSTTSISSAPRPKCSDWTLFRPVGELARKICGMRVGTPAERAAKKLVGLADSEWSEAVEEFVERFRCEQGGVE